MKEAFLNGILVEIESGRFDQTGFCKGINNTREIKDICTVVPTKSDSGVMFCLQLLSKTLTCTLHLN